jgi:hypothetical protein
MSLVYQQNLIFCGGAGTHEGGPRKNILRIDSYLITMFNPWPWLKLLINLLINANAPAKNSTKKMLVLLLYFSKSLDTFLENDFCSSFY